MSPHRRLVLLVTLTAVGIAIVWFFLFRSHVLTPPMSAPQGPSLSDISKQFEDSLDRLRKVTESATPKPSSDDARAPAP